jgi:hypothetical protein
VPLDPDWVVATLDRMEQLVLTGDESHLAEQIVALVTSSDGGETAVVYDK